MTQYSYVNRKSESYVAIAVGSVMVVGAVWLTWNGFLLGTDRYRIGRIGESDGFFGPRVSAAIWIAFGLAGVGLLIRGIRTVRDPDHTIVVSADSVVLPTAPKGKEMVTLRPDQIRSITVVAYSGSKYLRVDHDGGTATVVGFRLNPPGSFALLSNDLASVSGVPIITRAAGDKQASS